MTDHAELSDVDLIHTILRNERELVAARFRHSLNTLDNTASLRQLRRDIARLHTTARSRELAQGLPKGHLMHTHRGTFAADAPAEAEEASKGGFLSGVVDKLTGKD